MASMADTVSLSAVFRMQPKDAVSYFRSKGYQVTDRWQEMLESAHARAFTVAKAMRMDLLQDIRSAVDDAISQGLTERDFIKALKPKLQAKGWWGEQVWVDRNGVARKVQLGSDRRLRTIYRVNTQTAYMAGRYRRQVAASQTHPYWQYIAVLDGATRPSHRALNGKVFRWDDPIWQYLYPPNGWLCRCRVRALTAAQVERMGLEVENSADILRTFQADVGMDERTGEVFQATQAEVTLPGGTVMRPDKGWSYNPGDAAYGSDRVVAQKLGAVADPDLRSQVIQTLNNSPLRQQEFSRWTTAVQAGELPATSKQALGFMDEGIQAASGLADLPPLLTMTAGRITDVLTAEQYATLPAVIAAPAAVLLDTTASAVLYVSAADNGEHIVITVSSAPGQADGFADVIADVSRLATTDLRASRYQLLQGAL